MAAVPLVVIEILLSDLQPTACRVAVLNAGCEHNGKYKETEEVTVVLCEHRPLCSSRGFEWSAKVQR